VQRVQRVQLEQQALPEVQEQPVQPVQQVQLDQQALPEVQEQPE
jgi:hypothetical protein